MKLINSSLKSYRGEDENTDTDEEEIADTPNLTALTDKEL